MKTLLSLVFIGILFLATANVYVNSAYGEDPSVTLNTPAINGLVVDINGGAVGGAVVENGIEWDWGDETDLEQSYFPNSHTYDNGGTYTVTVTAHFKDGAEKFASVGVTVGGGIKSGGFTLTIESGSGGSLTYISSLGEGSVTPGNPVELYLAAGDPVWGIFATSDEDDYYGNAFDTWTVSGEAMAMDGKSLISPDDFGLLVGEAGGKGTVRANFAQVFLGTPAINGLTVDINGGALPGGKIDEAKGMTWDWDDGKSDEEFFPNSHTYEAGGTYVVTVTANYLDGDRVFTAFRSIEIIVGEGIKRGGFTLTIDNRVGGGSVSYSSSLGDGLVESGGSVELYLAEGDPVWGITATPNSGMDFASWSISGGVGFMGTSSLESESNPVDISVGGDGSLFVSFMPSFVVPEYSFGVLAALGVCFAAFVIFKKRNFLQGSKLP